MGAFRENNPTSIEVNFFYTQRNVAEIAEKYNTQYPTETGGKNSEKEIIERTTDASLNKLVTWFNANEALNPEDIADFCYMLSIDPRFTTQYASGMSEITTSGSLQVMAAAIDIHLQKETLDSLTQAAENQGYVFSDEVAFASGSATNIIGDYLINNDRGRIVPTQSIGSFTSAIDKVIGPISYEFASN